MSIRLEDLPPKAREQAARKLLAGGKRNNPQAAGGVQPPERGREGKYHNQKAVRVMEDGTEIRFDSQKEARRFDELLCLQGAGRIKDLRLQADFTLREAYTTPEGYRVRAIKYRADFTYEERVGLCDGTESWRLAVEDVKSQATKTRVYEVKKKLMLEKYGVLVREV